MRVSFPPPVFTRETFFSLRSAPAETPQNAGLSAHLSEPRAPADRPIWGRFPSLPVPFLWRNRTTPVLVRMLEGRGINVLEEARRGAGSKGARSGEVTWDRNAWVGHGRQRCELQRARYNVRAPAWPQINKQIRPRHEVPARAIGRELRAGPVRSCQVELPNALPCLPR